LEDINPAIVRQFDQAQFAGFSFVNMETFADFEGGDMIPGGASHLTSLAETKAAEDRWFKPKASRKAVVEFLKKSAVGSFCVRESSSHIGSYALSVNVGQPKPWNGLISTVTRSTGQIAYRLFPGTKFESIAHAVDFYRSKPILRDSQQQAIKLQLP
jgi:hypothetical protein